MTKSGKLGNMQIEEDSVLQFEEGILGFESVKRYVLLQEEDVPFLMTLQALDSEHPSFLVADPFAIVADYQPVLSREDMRYFHGAKPKDLRLLVIMVVTETVSDAVVNLKSPLVIDVRTNRSKQVILENSDYPIRKRLFDGQS